MAPAFDGDAVERLLSMYPPAGRADLLRSFQGPRDDDPQLRVRRVFRLGHPTLQAALEEAWAPYWLGLSDEEMALEPDYIPGREAARRRRDNESRNERETDGTRNEGRRGTD